MDRTRKKSGRVGTWSGSFPIPPAADVAVGVLAALAVWVVAVPLLGVSLAVQFSAGTAVQEVGLVSVGATALVGGLVAWVSLAGVERLVKSARTVWIGVAVLVLFVSLIAPMTSGTSTGAKVTLTVMHLVVGAILIWGMHGAKGHQALGRCHEDLGAVGLDARRVIQHDVGPQESAEPTRRFARSKAESYTGPCGLLRLSEHRQGSFAAERAAAKADSRDANSRVRPDRAWLSCPTLRRRIGK